MDLCKLILGVYPPQGTFEHEYLARQLFLNGRSAASFWVHDEMKSIDLLSALPFVDADNIGVAGCSGGGTQSAYVGAVDPRVKAVSIACYMVGASVGGGGASEGGAVSEGG